MDDDKEIDSMSDDELIAIRQFAIENASVEISAKELIVKAKEIENYILGKKSDA
jgi:hypothetical protein